MSDSSFQLCRGGTDKERKTFRSRDFRDVVEHYSDGGGSQWEAVTTDRSGRIFILQEHPGHVFIFDPAADRLVRALSLKVPDTAADWARCWRKDPNARGEALVLLEGGCILVIKQKDPIALIEFRPPCDCAARGAFLADGEEFSDPGALRPGRSWLLDKAAAERLESISDAAVLDQRLYVLSAKSRCIAELQPLPDEGRAAALNGEPLAVPDEIEHPEGLVILASSRSPLIASDLKPDESGDNVFLLEPLPA